MNDLARCPAIDIDIGSPNTHCAYTIAIVKTADQLDGRGPDGLLADSRTLATVTDAEVGAALEALWGEAAVNTWKARRAAVGKWLSWCREQGWDAPTLPPSAGRSTPPDSDALVRSRTAIDRLISRRDVHVREKALWRMCCSCTVKSKGAKPRTRCRGVGYAEHVLETGYWDAGTTRLLPRLIKDRTQGPLFVTHRRPGPGKYLADWDMCPTPVWPDCPTTRPAACSTLRPQSTGPGADGTCAGSAAPASHTWARPAPACWS